MHVIYGLVGLKVHCKIALIVRREHEQIRRYVHLGTGNYHPKTARLYTDYGLFTSDNTIGVDVQKIFHQLTAPGRPGKLKRLLQWMIPVVAGAASPCVMSLFDRPFNLVQGGERTD